MFYSSKNLENDPKILKISRSLTYFIFTTIRGFWKLGFYGSYLIVIFHNFIVPASKSFVTKFLFIFNSLEMTTSFVLAKTNFIIVENNEEVSKSKFCKWVRFLSENSVVRTAMTKHTMLNFNMLREMFVSANVSNQGAELGFTCTIKGKNSQNLRKWSQRALDLPTDNYEDTPDDVDIINFFNSIHCTKEGSGKLPKKLYIKHLPKEWNFFFNCISHVFVPKTGGFHGITLLNQKIGIAIV